MTPDTTVTFAFISIVVSLFLGISGFIANRDAKKVHEGREHGIIVTKLEAIETNQTMTLNEVKRVKQSIERLEDKVEEIDKRVVILETKRKRITQEN